MGCGVAKPFRHIKLYDLANIILHKQTMEIGNLTISYKFIKNIDIEENDILLYIEVSDIDKYLFIFENKDDLYFKLASKLYLS